MKIKMNLIVTSLCCTTLLLTTACSTFLKKNNASNSDAKLSAEDIKNGAANANGVTADGSSGSSDQVATFRVTDPALPELVVPEFDNMPEVLVPTVDKWVQYFQGKGREHMERYLARSTRYEKIMKKILRQNGLPEDLIYIALIESGFSPRAISRSAAVGYWQFIRGTGKRYGLQINTYIDERRDPVVATQAAAEYFKELYIEFNSWFLSMASYNVGEGRVRKEIRRNKTNDFWVLAKKRRLPKETVNYIPKFLAARMIAKNPEKFGFKEVPYEPPIEFETVTLTQPVDMRQMAEKMNVDYAELKRLNPKYRGEVAPLEGNKLVLRVPLATVDIAMKAGHETAVKQLVFIADRGETDVYKVRNGDNLNRIARRFKTNVGLLRELNDFKRRIHLKPGSTIFIPLRESESLNYEKAQMQSRLNGKPNNQKSQSEEALYIVQDGDSLPEIALKNNMTMAELMDLNSLNEGEALKNGTQLKVRKFNAEQSEPVMDVVLNNPKDVEKKESDKVVNVAKNENGSKSDVVPAAKAESSGAQQNEPVVKTDSATVAKAEISADVKNENSPKSEEAKINQAAKKDSAITSSLKPENLKVESAGSIASNKGENSSLNTANESTVMSLRKHMVKSGENLFQIAKKYGVSIYAIKKVNKIKKRRTRIKAGSILLIPSDENDNEKSNSQKVDNTFNHFQPEHTKLNIAFKQS